MFRRSVEDNIGFRMKYRYGYYSPFLYLRFSKYVHSPRTLHPLRSTLLNIFRFQLLHVYNETFRGRYKSKITLPFCGIYYRVVNIPLYYVPQIRDTRFFTAMHTVVSQKYGTRLYKSRYVKTVCALLARTGRGVTINFIYTRNEREVKCESSAKNKIPGYKWNDSLFSVAYVGNVSRVIVRHFPLEGIFKRSKACAYKAQALRGRMSRIKTN